MVLLHYIFCQQCVIFIYFCFKVNQMNSTCFDNVTWLAILITSWKEHFLEVLVSYLCGCWGQIVRHRRTGNHCYMVQCQADITGGAEQREGTAISAHADPVFLNVCSLSVFQQWLIMHAYSVHLLTVRLEIMSSIKKSKTERSTVNGGWKTMKEYEMKW